MKEHLQIFACSDLHGQKFDLVGSAITELQPDWILLLGDILPDFPRIPGQQSRLVAQREFWRTYRRTFLREGARTTFVRGNHEIEGFRDTELDRLPAGLEGQVVRLEGVPAEFGQWGWSREWDEDKLEQELNDQLRDAPNPSIYVSHVPPHGCLDVAKGGEHVGHRPLAQHLEGRGWPKALVLCGHVHEGFGCAERGQTLIVNVACGYAVLDWNAAKGFKVFDMERF